MTMMMLLGKMVPYTPNVHLSTKFHRDHDDDDDDDGDGDDDGVVDDDDNDDAFGQNGPNHS